MYEYGSIPPLLFYSLAETFNCLEKTDGTYIPNHTITSMEPDAKFVLVIEKDTVVER